MPELQTILALNSGSSSLKLSLYRFQNGTFSRLVSGQAEEIGSDKGQVTLKSDRETLLKESRNFAGTEDAAKFLIGFLVERKFPNPDAIGHRIVHGGPQLREHQVITPEVLTMLERAVPFAPLHLPPALEVLRYSMQRFRGIREIACFDTAFHRTLPECAARLPFSREFWDKGLQRYGFHGLSFESIVDTLGSGLPSKLVVAHLGNGCSLCAIRDGKSIDTTMGLTPTGGVMMGTRCGDLDPGVLLHLLREGYSGETLDRLLNHESGLRGVSGKTNDMRQLLASAPTDNDAALAVEMFCYVITKFMGAMTAALGGIELLVFTGGIGEHAAAIRGRICGRLEHLNIRLDEAANENNADTISAPASKCPVRVIPTDEDLQMARHCVRLAGN
jgi:acetate kinase